MHHGNSNDPNDERIGPFGNQYENPELPPPWFDDVISNAFDAESLIVFDGVMSYKHDENCDCGREPGEVYDEHRHVIIFEHECTADHECAGAYPDGKHREAASFDDAHAKGVAFSILRRLPLPEIVKIAADAMRSAADPFNIALSDEIMRQHNGGSMEIPGMAVPPSPEGLEFLNRGAGDVLPTDEGEGAGGTDMPDGEGEGRS